MKKLILILAIALLALGAVYYAKNNTGISSVNSIHADSATVHKLFIADMANNTVTVQRGSDGRWRHTADSQKCSEYPVQHLLYVLHEAKPTQVVNASLRSTVLKDLSVTGTTVEAYDKDNKLLRRFVLGGDAVNAKRGCYVLASSSQDPCVYDILSYDGHFQTQINAKPLTWRSLTIMQYQPQDIQSIQVDYAYKADSSFMLQRSSDSTFNLRVAAAPPVSNINAKKVSSYLAKLADNRCLGYENTNVRAQQILNEDVRYAKITIATKQGVSKVYLYIFARADKRAKTVERFNGVAYDPEFLFCWDGADLSLTRFDYMGNLLCMPSYFK